MAIDAAEKFGVPGELVCAIIEVSSGWNESLIEWAPSSWLMAQHPQDLGGEEKWIALGTRWGPLQVRGQEAWMAGYKTVERLAKTEENLLAGCLTLKTILTEERKTLLLWFGNERKSLAHRAIAILPLCLKFIEAKPIHVENST